MATETLNIFGWDNGWPDGFVSNVDERILKADGSAVSTSIADDVVVFDLTDISNITDLDIVTNVTVTVRTRVSTTAGAPILGVELLVGGASQGSASVSPGTTYQNLTVDDLGAWDSDWTLAQLNSMQLRITPSTITTPIPTWYIDCIDVVITYTEVDPVIRAPAEADLTLAGKAPDVGRTNEYVPARAQATLAGKVPVFDRGVAVDNAAAYFAGKISYINSQQTRLAPNGWDNTGGWSGFLSNIDEPVTSPDGSTASTDLSLPLTIDYSNVPGLEIQDLSTVLSVVVRIRSAFFDESGFGEVGLDVAYIELLIDGISRGGTFIVAPYDTYVVRSLNLAGWNQDWTVAQLNSLQVRISPELNTPDVRFYIDCVDVIVEHVPQSPFNLRVDPTALTLAGQAGDTLDNSLRAPASYAAALTGKQPDLSREDVVEIPHALRRLNRKKALYVPTVLENSLRTPAKYTGTLAGKAPARISNHLRAPSEGDLTLTVKTPTYERTQDYDAFPARGQLYTVGQNVLPQDSGGTNTYIDPSRVRVYLTGKAPGLSLSDNPRFAPPAVAGALSGKAPVMDTGSSPARGTLALTGEAPDMDVGLRFTPASLPLSLTTYQPNVDDLVGLLTLTGYAPVQSLTKLPAAVSLTLTPQRPRKKIGYDVEVEDPATLLFTGSAPSLRFSTALTPGQPGFISLSIEYDIEFIGTPTDIVEDD